MNVLIIGGTGLISTGITRALQDQGVDVTHYNRRQAPSQLQHPPTTLSGDRKDFAAFEAQMAAAGPFDCIIDMVCFTAEEAESAVRAFRGCTPHLIFCSTVDIYAKGVNPLPIREDALRSALPSFPYASQKVKCEQILENAAARGDFDLTIIRPAYTYGEGRGLLHTFRFGMYYLQRLRTGKPIVVHGDGTSLWTACHRDDVGRAFAAAVGNPAARNKAYHVTGEEWLSWNRYHALAAEAIGAPEPELVHIPTDTLYRALPAETEWCKENFQYNNIFDNRAAHADLGFRYTIPWQEGVRRIVAWLDARSRISDEDEPPFYAPLIEAWRRAETRLATDMRSTA